MAHLTDGFSPIVVVHCWVDALELLGRDVSCKV
jgi:hypothetical protein